MHNLRRRLAGRYGTLRGSLNLLESAASALPTASEIRSNATFLPIAVPGRLGTARAAVLGGTGCRLLVTLPPALLGLLQGAPGGWIQRLGYG
jgi:hypothetical protein